MQSPTPEQEQGRSPFSPRPRNRGWIWFFVALVILAVAAIVIQVRYNLSQQLTRSQLQSAEAKWKAKAPSDYNMDYTFKKVDSTETYSVQVRNGKVLSVLHDGQPQEKRLYRYADMSALFGFLEEFLDRDSQEGSPRVFATATFDREDGHLIHYVRSVMSTRERQEITVKFHAKNP
jgi:hypothetical protein